MKYLSILQFAIRSDNKHRRNLEIYIVTREAGKHEARESSHIWKGTQLSRAALLLLSLVLNALTSVILSASLGIYFTCHAMF